MADQGAAPSPAGRLIDAGEYAAFVPHDLPPALRFGAELVAALSAADRALGELAGLGRALPNPHLLIRPFIRREAVLSSRIEGTQAGVSDVFALEAGRPLPAPDMRSLPPYEDDVKEVLNYVRALEYGLATIAAAPPGGAPIDLEFIRALHARLMDGLRVEHSTPGEFRRHQNWIGRPGSSVQEADFVPPPVDAMQAALAAFERYLQSEDPNPPLVRLALIHYQFEAIHPFIDGNGRIGRLLIALLVIAWGLLPLPLLYLSAFFERRLRDYYGLLRAVSERGAWDEWLGFFLQGVAEQSRDAIARAQRLQDLRQEWRERLEAASASANLLRLADSLFESPVLTIPQAQQALGVTYRGAKLNVDRLLKEGILSPGGDSSYGKSYLAEDIIRILEERRG
jgi:Fic family protein